jgi:hypothetical protein
MKKMSALARQAMEGARAHNLARRAMDGIPEGAVAIGHEPRKPDAPDGWRDPPKVDPDEWEIEVTGHDLNMNPSAYRVRHVPKGAK